MSLYKLSDQEISKRVAQILYPDHKVEAWHGDSVIVLDENSNQLGPFDYCNSWADTGPISYEKRISIVQSLIAPTRLWSAYHLSGGEKLFKTALEQVKPLRAVSICLLMMYRDV